MIFLRRRSRRQRRGVATLFDPELVEVMTVQERSKVLVPALERMAQEIATARAALPDPEDDKETER